MESFLNYLQSLPDDLIYAMLGLSAFVENVFPPIPGDTITAFGAFLVGIGRLDFWGVYVATTIGSLVGFMALFGVGGYLGRRFFIEKDYRFFKAKDILRAEEWFRRYGYMLIAINRFIPGARSVISLAGGLARLRAFGVGILALISCAVWNLIWIFAGYGLGVHWEVVEKRMAAIMLKYNAAIGVAVALVVGFVVVRTRYKRKKAQDASVPPSTTRTEPVVKADDSEAK
jgi:membrane protein DedA with SNARE-associated domain